MLVPCKGICSMPSKDVGRLDAEDVEDRRRDVDHVVELRADSARALGYTAAS